MQKPVKLLSRYVLSLSIVLAVILLIISNNTKVLANRQDETQEQLQQLQVAYQRLNDDLYEVKLSRDRLHNRVEELEKQLAELQATKNAVAKEVKKQEEKPVGKKIVGTLHTITCYDLSEDSNGTWKGHPYYGLTANGFDLRGHTWDSARTVAVDKSLYPLGTKLRLTFTNDKYSKYNGVYTARDTGGAIKGKKIDLFLGDFGQRRTAQAVWDFGKTQAYVEVVK